MGYGKVSSYFLCIGQPKDYVRCALQGDQVRECERRTTGLKREAQEKGKTGGHAAGQGAEDGKNQRMVRGQTFEALCKEVHKLHLADCPNRPSLDAD